jgi:hypothetical protein
MARLTKYQRDAFVEAVMQDVPTIDYEKQAHDLVKNAALAALPPQVRAIAANKELSHYLETTNHWFGYHQGDFSSVTVFQGRCTNYMTDEVRKQLDAIVELAKAQNERLSETRAKVRAAIGGCSTDRIARERLPEFAKYLPEPEEKTPYLPAVANIVADLVSLGWPKDGEKAASA